MTTFEIVSKDLQKFGLSPNQVLIYLALIQHGELRIQELADLAKIPRSSVYENLNGLLEIGLIEKIIDHKFVRIKPYPISHLRNNLEEQSAQILKLQNDLIHLEETLTLLPNAEDPKTVIRYYKSISGARQLFYNSLNSQDTVYVYSSYGRSKFLGKSFYTNFVRESKEKHIKEKVLINPTEQTLEHIRRDTGSALARTQTQDIRFLSAEKLPMKGETLIYNNVFAQIDLKAEEISGFEIESKSFIEMQRSIFETLWKIAQPFSELIH